MTELGDVLTKLGEELKEDIWAKSEVYCLVDIGKTFEAYGITDDAEKYKEIKAVVPLKKTLGGLNVFVKGKGFSDYAQLKSGIAVPEWVAEESGLPYKEYKPKENMTLSFAPLKPKKV